MTARKTCTLSLRALFWLSAIFPARVRSVVKTGPKIELLPCAFDCLVRASIALHRHGKSGDSTPSQKSGAVCALVVPLAVAYNPKSKRIGLPGEVCVL